MPKKTVKKLTKPNKTTKEQLRTVKKKKEFIEIFTTALGNIGATCLKTGIARVTFYEWMKTDNDFKQRVENLPEIRLDFAENQLNKLMKKDHPAAIIFFLKTKGKQRGYIERTEIDAQVKDDRLTSEHLAEAWKKAQAKDKPKKKIKKKLIKKYL